MKFLSALTGAAVDPPLPQKRAVVFIPQQPTRFDHEQQMRVPTVRLDPAMEFGDLVAIVPDGLSPIFAAPIVQVCREKLRAMRADDFIVPVGDPVIIAIVCGIALNMHRRINLLRWDRNLKRYGVIEVQL
jgi:hypothetical protein